jgi:hypothetical protein
MNTLFPTRDPQLSLGQGVGGAGGNPGCRRHAELLGKCGFELMTMQGVYRKWVGTLPPSLEASATVDALRAICELDLSKLDSVEPPRGFGRD